jgi:hypothetical protein
LIAHFPDEAVMRRSKRCVSRIAEDAPHKTQIMAIKSGEVQAVSFETPESPLQPSIGERAIDTATDVSRTITEVSTGLRAAVDRLSDAIAASRQPGGALATVTAITREAPLASLFVAFLFGVAVARRRQGS